MTAERTCRLLTLGCKVNQYETQYVREMLELNGYHEADVDEAADLCIVNTCTVTHEGDAKSRQMIRRYHQQYPQSKIVVMGCYATRDPDAVRRLPGVQGVITDKEKLLEELSPYGVTLKPAGISRFDDHQRAFVKVQDGCLLNCSYCIIPTVRPVLRSRPVEEIVAEVERLVDSGYGEVVLTGVHLGHYGIDRSKGKPRDQWVRLWHLIDRLGELQGDFRIRLSSLEAAEARDSLIEVLGRQPRICPHLHLCLQSGSDRILALMRRRYRRAGFLERCRRIKAALDLPAFTTDVILGFPGETEEDFEATCDVVRQVGFCKIHVFSYSPRAGTPAAELREIVPPEVVASRRQRLLQLEHELARIYQQRLLGRTLDVLVEGSDSHRPGFVKGTSCRSVPVVFRGHLPALIRRRVPVLAVALEGNQLVGEPLPGHLEPMVTQTTPRQDFRISLPMTTPDV
jgi:threonylcarbamoyladenosine tRNA methylthiotransferase MtaB